MDFQDWKEVTWNKKGVKQKNETKENFLKRHETTIVNKNNKKPDNLVMSSRKLEANAEEGILSHKTVSLSIARRIAQKRCEMKLSQKDLAMKLSIPESIIKSYEKTEAIPNPIVLNKIEKILGRVRD